MNLQEIRERLSELDRQLLALIAERQRLSREVAEAKRTEGRATRDFSRERDVLMQARATADSLGISPVLAESVLRLLIRGSLTAQERIRVAAGGRGGGKTAMVIGGTGKMGRWFTEFLASQGYSVTIADPHGRLVWLPPALPGATHDLTTARTHGIIAALTSAAAATLADKRTAAPATRSACRTTAATYRPGCGTATAATTRSVASANAPTPPSRPGDFYAGCAAAHNKRPP